MRASAFQVVALVVLAGVGGVWLLGSEREASPSAPLTVAPDGRDIAEPNTARPEEPAADPSAIPIPHTSASSDASVVPQPPHVAERLRRYPLPPLMASELVDPLWAPDMEATIDGSIRSIGSLIADVEVECRTMRCRALIFFQPSLFQLEEPKVRSHVMTTFDRLNEIGDTLIRQSDRLDEASGMGFVGLGELTDRPIDEFNQHEFTAIIWHIGAASPAN